MPRIFCKMFFFALQIYLNAIFHTPRRFYVTKILNIVCTPTELKENLLH